jgi:allophanate hydrolase subunit 2
MIKAVGTALFREEKPAQFGLQDRGKSPGGVIDRFSLEIGQILLGTDSPHCYSLVFGKKLILQEDIYLFITGAKYRSIRCNGNEIPMNVVVRATKNSLIEFESKIIGFRTYLLALPISKASSNLSGRERGPYDAVFSWAGDERTIRILPGPESDILSNMQEIEGEWKVNRKSNEMGLRLEREAFVPPLDLGSMVSQPVVDGTVQLTPSGPLILLRERQTIGGYPRVAVVINSDIDLLAQYGPDSSIVLSEVSIEEACEAYLAKQKRLAALRKTFVK